MSSTIVQPVITDENILELTNYINQYRSRHNSPPVTWNNIIANYSQQWSYTMTETNNFKHSGSALYGENISYLIGYGSDVITLMKLAIDDWYNEISLYNFNNPGYSSATGHFTCLIWKSSINFGMGISLDINQAYICFNNSPPSNVIGQFQENVLPLVTSPPIPTPNPVPPKPNPPPINPRIPPNINKPLVINQLYMIMNRLNRNYPRKNILNDLYIVMNNIILNYNSKNRQSIIDGLNHIINEVKFNYPKNYIINDLNHLINSIIIHYK
jgi:hypothetical protein